MAALKKHKSIKKEKIKKLKKAIPAAKLTLDKKQTLFDTLENAIKHSEKTGFPGAFINISLDNLALIIGWYSFDFADEIIENLIKKIQSFLGKEAIVQRIYIDQIGIILENSTKEKTEVISKKIYDVIEEFEFTSFKKPMHITSSIGSVDFPVSATSAGEALNKAFIALSTSKNSGESFYYEYREAEKRQLHSKSQTMLMHYIHDAVEENKVRLAFQPVVEAKTGKIRCYESLLRIIGEDGRINSAGAIIPIAEKMGFIDTIDKLVLEEVVKVLKQYPDISLSFNASSLTTDNPKWLKLCNKLLKDHELASRVIVEITETAAQRDLRETAYFVASLQSLGCLVALDDFGAGYTSFRQLKTLSVDLIKIDGTFIKDIANFPDNRLFVKTLLDFTNCYGLKTIAECVETGDSAKVLMDMNVDYMQGYYFGAPEITPDWAKVPKKIIKN